MSWLVSRSSQWTRNGARSFANSFGTRWQTSAAQSMSVPLFVPSEMKAQPPQLVLSSIAEAEIPKLRSPIYPVGIVGQSRSGKSAFFDALASYVVEHEQGSTIPSDSKFFVSSSSNKPVTKGIDFLTLPFHDGTLVFMDCEGIDAYDEGLSAPLSAINMLFSKVLFTMSRDTGDYLTKLMPKLVTYPGEKKTSVLYFNTITNLFVTSRQFEEIFNRPEMAAVAKQFPVREMFKMGINLQGQGDTLEEFNRSIAIQLRDGNKKLIERYGIWNKLRSELSPIEVNDMNLNGEQFLSFIETTIAGFNNDGVLSVTMETENLWFRNQAQFPKDIGFAAYKAAMRWAETAAIVIPQTRLDLTHSENKASAVLEFRDRVSTFPQSVQDSVARDLEAVIDGHFATIVSNNSKKTVQPPNKLLGTVSTTILGDTLKCRNVVFSPDIKNQISRLVCDYSPRLGQDGANVSGWHSSAANGLTSAVLDKFSSLVLSAQLANGHIEFGSPSTYNNSDVTDVTFGTISGSATFKNVRFDSYDGEVLSSGGGSLLKFDVSKSQTESFEFSLTAKGTVGSDKAKGEAGATGTWGLSKTQSNATSRTYSSNWKVSDTQVAVFNADLELSLRLERTYDPELWTKILSLGINAAFVKSDTKTATAHGTAQILVPINQTKVFLSTN